MAIGLGEEFKAVAAPRPELMRTLLHFAMRDNGSVLTPELMAGAIMSRARTSNDTDDVAFMWTQYLESVQEQIAHLSSRIDALEQASFEALQEAEQQLDATRRAANQATDGRRVYETEDGRAIFDEQGQEVSRDDVDADRWDPDGPKWEQYQHRYGKWRDARDFHDKVLHQKERLASNPDQEELDDIGDALDELEQDMPPAVRAHYDAQSVDAAGVRSSAASSIDDKPVFASAPDAEQAFAKAADPAQSDRVMPEPATPQPAPPDQKFTL
jgi:hypothetical protein